MNVKITVKSTGKRLTIVCEEEPRKTVLVKGHFRVVGGKTIYVKAHHRKR